MIIVRLSGGIGNQMFQYAAGRSLATLRKVPLKLDLSGFKNTAAGDTIRSFALGTFAITAESAQPEEVRELCGTHGNPRAKTMQNLADRLVPMPFKTRFREPHFHYTPDLLRLGNNVYLDGFWQSEKYFRDVRQIIQDEFSFRKPLTGENATMAENIASCSAVALHVRRGDFEANPVTNRYHGTCPPEYYRQAMTLVSGMVSNPHFFIFSDDPAWCRKNLDPSRAMTFVDHNTTDSADEDLRLMSLCGHAIIANSSFSWWGAWLIHNPDKVVVAPHKWFNERTINTDDLIPSSWRRI
ncbi:MAG: alpha-1,2-fucosyltransferase [Desulfuromonadales bacterium]|nr:alpha-1,2-fucosyltransferase [Desulfuromonadales bacterium]